MKKMLSVLLVAVMVITIGMIALAGPTIHVKALSYGPYEMVAPGVGLYYLGNSAFGFGADLTFGGVSFAVEPAEGCEDPTAWEMGILGFVTVGPFYDIAIGGCDAGPCSTGAIRLGVGLGLPMVFASTDGASILAIDSAGVVISAAYVWDNDVFVKGEAFWDGIDVGYTIGLHVDMFSLGDWIRGNGDRDQTLDELLGN